MTDSQIEKSSSPEPQIKPAILLGFAAIALGPLYAGLVAFWLQHPILQFPDQSLYLEMAGLFLDGKRPYVDMVDFNPPLILYISTLPVLIARSVHIPVILSFSIFILALILISLCLSGVLMYRNRKSKEAFFYVPFLVAFLFLCREMFTDFGQREHILIITYLPFFLVRFFRWNGLPINKYLAILCGLYAALSLALKPHFLLMAMAPELVYFLQKRRFKEFITPETIACAFFGFVYGAHFFFLDPAVRDRFFNFVVPLVKNGYEYYTVSIVKTIADLARNDSYWLALLTILAFPLSRSCALIAPTAAFTAASFAVHVLASQDWSHHWIPVRFGILALLCLELAVVVRALCAYSAHTRLLNNYMSAIILSLGLTWWAIARLPAPNSEKQFDLSAIGYKGRCPYDDVGPWLDIVLKYSKKGDPVLFISDAMAPGYPATVQLERKAGSRYLHGMPFMMTKYVAWEKKQVNDRIKFLKLYDEIINQYGEDIKRIKPTLIVVGSPAMMIPLESTNFIALHMRDYNQVDEFEGYLIYQRKHDSD